MPDILDMPVAFIAGAGGALGRQRDRPIMSKHHEHDHAGKDDHADNHDHAGKDDHAGSHDHTGKDDHTDKHNHDHGGGSEHHHAPPDRMNRAFAIGMLLNIVFAIVGIVAGLKAHSTALLADAAHNMGVTEELLVEAHEVRETPLSAAMFSAGFLTIMIADMVA